MRATIDANMPVIKSFWTKSGISNSSLSSAKPVSLINLITRAVTVGKKLKWDPNTSCLQFLEKSQTINLTQAQTNKMKMSQNHSEKSIVRMRIFLHPMSILSVWILLFGLTNNCLGRRIPLIWGEHCHYICHSSMFP